MPCNLSTIALVGNSSNSVGFSNEIDACDLVVRINSAAHCGAAGVRTDALALINWSGGGYSLLSERVLINPSALDAASEIWIPMAAEEMQKVRASHNPIPPPPAYTDLTNAIIKRFARNKRCIYFPARSWSKLSIDLQSFGANADDAASTGALVLHYLCEHYPHSIVKIFGFSHEGWPGHPWEAERRWIDSLSNVERVE